MVKSKTSESRETEARHGRVVIRMRETESRERGRRQLLRDSCILVLLYRRDGEGPTRHARALDITVCIFVFCFGRW